MAASKSPDPPSGKHPFPNLFSFWRKSKKPNADSPPWTRLYRRFTLKELRIATRNFDLKLGQGGFSSVYKGFISGGFKETVAVKMYNSLDAPQLFLREMEFPAKRDHPNILSLECFEAHVPFYPSCLKSLVPPPKNNERLTSTFSPPRKNEPLLEIEFQDSDISVSDYDSDELLRD
ncbi:hypothetical protein V6N13_055036 [Hibiscus sabdariffa]